MNKRPALFAALAVVAMAAAATGDIGITVTGLAVAPALVLGRGVWLKHLLAISWAVMTVERLAGATMDTVVFSIAAMDLIIAGAALTRLTYDSSRIDARMIGGISMALMPAHWIMSASHGVGPWWAWPLYASAVNAGFVLQCLIVGGKLDHVGRSIGDFFGRLNPVRLLHRGGR